MKIRLYSDFTIFWYEKQTFHEIVIQDTNSIFIYLWSGIDCEQGLAPFSGRQLFEEVNCGECE